MELAGPTERELDAESAGWLRRLSAGNGVWRKEAEGEFHAQLLRIALAEVNRRAATAPFDTIGPQPDLTVPALGQLPAALIS